MKKSILLLTLAFSLVGCAFSEDNRYLNIRNNTDKTEIITFGFSSNGIILKSGKSTEIVCNSDFNTLACSRGAMSFETLSEDTTLEINPDCWYLGEEKHFYWTERR